VLVPSLINPPHVLDLDRETSLADALAESGRVLLLDWGEASDRGNLSVTGHIQERLIPLLEELGEPVALIGYCLGGTMALAAAGSLRVRGVATLASPWHFSAYPQDARDSLTRIWQNSRSAAERIGVLPIEVLQAAFWSLDPQRVVTKYARLAGLDQAGDEFRRFVRLEDWANGGEPLPLPAARELIEDLFARDLPGHGRWANLPDCPLLHFTANADRIVPADTAAQGERIACPAGHVGMIVGRGARPHLHDPLRDWLARLPQRG
jgi:polyhydroxyalkanoate synthase